MFKKIYINGMFCSQCVSRVEKALQTVIGVKNVKVDLLKKIAFVELDQEVEDFRFFEAIDNYGYRVDDILNDI